MSSAIDREPRADREKTAYQFVLRLSGGDLTDALADALFESGCDDALLSSVNGQLLLEFERQADSLRSAVLSAIHAVEQCGQPVTVVGVSPPDAEEIEILNAVLRTRHQGRSLLNELGAT
jgi:hypothetical protein